MEIVKRNRGGMKGRTISFSDKKVKYNFDIQVLDLFCSFVVSKNQNIKRSHLVNMRNLFETIDLSVYESDIEKMKRLRFIQRALEAKLVENISNQALVLTYINGGIIKGEVCYSVDDIVELDNSEVDFINNTISGALKCTFIEDEMDKFYDLYVRYKAQDFRYRDVMIAEIEEFVKNLNNKFRKAKAETAADKKFSLDNGIFENSFSDIYDTLTSPSRFLYSMMQGFNMVVGGGLEATRFYLLLGMAGVGKSMTLLNLALQMKKANKGYQTKDPTKIPTILYLTQENTVEETVDRICSIISGKNMAAFEKQEIMNILRTEGELMLNDENNINIHIIYRPDRSIDTSDLYTIIEDLEDDGYEVICLLQDHIKRIRSAYNFHGDIRLELGAVVNEMKILAQLKQIPILSVSHLNRDASKTIDNTVRGNKADLTRFLGRANVGESLLMIDNADCALIVNNEYDMDGNKYMIFYNIKIRNSGLLRDYICQPFENGTKLAEDLYRSPVFKETLVPEQQAPTVHMNGGAALRNSTYNNISVLDIDDNIFDSPMSGLKYGSLDSNEEDILPIQPATVFQPGVSISIPTSVIIEQDKDEDEEDLPNSIELVSYI